MRTTAIFLAILPVFLVLGCFPGKMVPDPETERVTYRADAEGIFYRPPSGPPVPGIILIHGDRGRTQFEEQEAHRISRNGFAVLAVDLYHGRGKEIRDLEDAHIMDRALPEEEVLADLKAAADFLEQSPKVQHGKLGVLGWDMGCGYALDAARSDPRITAVVACEGRLITDPELLKPMQAPVFAVFAGKDAGVDETTISQFRAAMEKAGKRRPEVLVVPAVEHGFLSSETPAAREAWGEIDRFFEAKLKTQ